jgi:hypothetical protein
LPPCPNACIYLAETRPGSPVTPPVRRCLSRAE